ncbi:hypothetical protein [Jidongwangia harbinensis]|uniref:hypothetical protein n=1 Tax=Jidongwangia harbinensis TaxID=2878561 RepID=UPI001CDA3A1C|nr:hypothetical protein [Jidongwangia harbinensis]MCA2215508.1 hypothetical protein [Jidongwangia harbinensis]
MSTWEAHVTAHAGIAAARRAKVDALRDPAHQEALESVARRRAEVASWTDSVVSQEGDIREVAAAVRTLVPLSDIRFGPAPPALPWGQAVDHLRAELAASRDATGEVYRLGYRARLFPGLAQTSRAVLIFLLCSIPMVVLNAIVMIQVLGSAIQRPGEPAPEPSYNAVLLLCSGIVLPALTSAVAALVTATVGRPRIRLTNNVLPGMAIGTVLCFVLSIVSMCLSQPLSLL